MERCLKMDFRIESIEREACNLGKKYKEEINNSICPICKTKHYVLEKLLINVDEEFKEEGYYTFYCPKHDNFYNEKNLKELI